MRSELQPGLDNRAETQNAPANNTASIAAKFEELRRRFMARTREDCAALENLRQNHAAPGPDLIPIVHRLAGTAGLLGYDSISTIAGRLDDELAVGTAKGETLQELLAVLKDAISLDDATN